MIAFQTYIYATYMITMSLFTKCTQYEKLRPNATTCSKFTHCKEMILKRWLDLGAYLISFDNILSTCPDSSAMGSDTEFAEVSTVLLVPSCKPVYVALFALIKKFSLSFCLKQPPLCTGHVGFGLKLVTQEALRSCLV